MNNIKIDHFINGFDFDREVVTLDGGGTIYGKLTLKYCYYDVYCKDFPNECFI